MSRTSLIILFCSVLALSRVAFADLQEAEEAFTKGNFSLAVEKYREALAASQRSGATKDIADLSYKLGIALNKITSFPDAVQALEQALKLHEQLQDRVAAGNDLTAISFAEMKQGNYDKALDLCNKALPIHESTGNKKGIADTYRNMGWSYQFLGEHDKAMDYSGRSFQIAKEIGDKQGMAISLKDLGGIQWRLSNFEKALEYYNQALPITLEIGDRITQFQVQGNMALVYWNQGDLVTALDFQEKVLKVTQEIGNKQGEAVTLFDIGLIQMEKGDYKKANEILRESLERAEAVPDKGLVSACWDGLGVMELELGNYDAALEYVHKAAQIAEEIGEKRPLAYELKNIGSIYNMEANYPESLKVYQKALKLYKELDEKRGIAITLNQAGAVEDKIGNLKEALALFQEALDLAKSIGSKPLLAESNLNIGAIYLKQGKLKEAEEDLDQGLKSAEEVGYPNLIWQSLHQRGLLYSKTGRNTEGIADLKRAVDVIEKVRSQVQLADQKAGYLEDKLEAYEDTIRLLVQTDNVAEAFEFAQRAKARSFLDMLAEARIDPYSTLRADQVERKRKLSSDLTNLNNKIQKENENEKPDKTKLEKLRQQQTELEEDYSNLIVEIRKSNPRYAAVQYPEPLKIAEAQKLLDEKSALLEYFVGKSGSFLFVITPETSSVFQLPSETKLAKLVEPVRQLMLKPEPIWETSEKSYTKWIAGSRALYDVLLRPAAAMLREKNRLVIAPDSALNYLPFESLLKKKTDSATIDFSKLAYVARDFEIDYVPSISVLAQVAAREPDTAKQKEFFAVADPDFKQRASIVRTAGGSDRALRALPNARLEVSKIAALYPKEEVTVLTGKEASEKNLKHTDLTQYKRVHFASHGLIDQDRPQLSALVLSSDPTDGEDGYLTMREVFDLKLHADFVVLSACRTGLGHQIRGEGISGLSRAFFCAGTSSVLVSLWDVSDRSTAEFMSGFYQHLASKGMTKTAALRDARLQMIASRKYSHPYYWAPFILIGNP